MRNVLLSFAIRFRCRKLVYSIIAPFCSLFCKYKYSSLSEAEAVLSKYHKDGGHSCISQNIVSDNPRYDLTIIIPAYNVESYIDDCIRSVINQKTIYSVKTVIIDDGSTDSTSQIIDHYKHYEDVLIIHQSNRGFSGARNAALQNIDSKYVMFVDSDDKLEVGSVEALLHKAYESNYDIVEGNYRLFDNDGKYVEYKHKPSLSPTPSSLFGQPWAKVYKSVLFINCQFPEKYWFEDTINQLVLYRKASKIAIINEFVYLYRNNPKSITNTSKISYKSVDTYWVTKQLLDDAKSLKIEFDRDYYDFLMHQMVINGRRILYLQNEKLFAAHLYAEKYLIERYFDFSVTSTTTSGQIMEDILRTVNYKRFALALTYIWDVL